MKNSSNLIGALIIALLQLASFPARADGLADCRQARDQASRMRACSALIADPGAAAGDKAIAHRNRGAARLDAGALGQARSDIDQALQLSPRDARAYELRGQIRLRQQDLDGAYADYSAAMSIDPGSATACNGRGYVELVRGNAHSAVADFSRAIALNPISATAYNNRGVAYRKAGDLERAVVDYTSAITLNPIYALAYENRGHAREAQGQKPFAIADYRRALVIDPSLKGAREGLTRLGAADETSKSQTLIGEGRGLVEAHCSRCHATGPEGPSPNPASPPFRDLHGRHPILALREPLTRGIAAPHDDMPHFALPDSAVDKIVAYINSLAAGR